LRVCQRHVLKLVENVPHLHGVALEESYDEPAR
jgi:hypothetical protein